MPYKEEAITSLIHFLNNGNEADRCYAARSLGVLQASSAVTALIERLRDEDIDVCIDAATALGQIAEPNAIPSLLEALEKEPDGEIKTVITTALGSFNDPNVREALNHLAINRPADLDDDFADWDCYWDIQLEAIKSLTKLGGTDKTDEIASLINDEETQDIESEILKVLACSGEAGFHHLNSKLNAPLSRSRRRAVQALKFQDSELSKQALKKALTDDDENVRLSALSSIKHLQATALFSDVLALISDSSAQVRQESLKVLSSFGAVSGESILTTEHLFPLLADTNSAVRLTILTLIKESVQKNKSALSAEELTTIKTSLNSKNSDEAAIACTIIGDAKDRDAADYLISILESTGKDEMLRKEATTSLGKLGITTPAVMQALQKHISGDSRIIRLAALQALVDLEKANKDTQVISLLNSDDKETTEEPVITNPMDLLIASLYGEINEEPEAQDVVTDNNTLERIDAVIIEDEAETIAEALTEETPQFIDANQSTLASLMADQAVIPEGYPSEYHELQGQALDGTEKRKASSTLEALTQENVEAALMGNKPMEPHVQSIMEMIGDLPEELSEFGDTVRANNNSAEQMIDQSKKTPLKNDVRHLAAKVLSTIDVSEESINGAQLEKLDRIIEGLILALSDQDDQLRCEAADTICQLAIKNPKTPGLSNTFGGLVTQLQFGTPEFRVKAVKALGPLEHKAGIPPLLDSLADNESNVRIHAIYSLGQLVHSDWSNQKSSHHMVLEDVTEEKITKRIVEMLDDPMNGVRKAAIDVLTDLQHQAALEKLVLIALENEGAMARVVGKTLRKMKSSEAATFISSQLKGSDSASDRRFLMELIEEMFKPEVMETQVA